MTLGPIRGSSGRPGRGGPGWPPMLPSVRPFRFLPSPGSSTTTCRPATPWAWSVSRQCPAWRCATGPAGRCRCSRSRCSARVTALLVGRASPALGLACEIAVFTVACLRPRRVAGLAALVSAVILLGAARSGVGGPITAATTRIVVVWTALAFAGGVAVRSQRAYVTSLAERPSPQRSRGLRCRAHHSARTRAGAPRRAAGDVCRGGP